MAHSDRVEERRDQLRQLLSLNKGDEMTHSDRTRQNPTAEPVEPLSLTDRQQLPTLTIAQENAIDLFIQGKSDREVAEAVGVTRQTVNEWRNQNAVFATALHTRRSALWAGERDRLRALVSQAVDVLAQGLESDNERMRHQAAVAVLRCVGLFGQDLTPSAPPGDGDPVLAQIQQVRAELRREVEREFARAGRPRTALDSLLELDDQDYVAQEVRQRLPGRLRALGLLEG